MEGLSIDQPKSIEPCQNIMDAYQSGRSAKPITEKKLLIDENTVKYSVRQYWKHRKEHLDVLGLSLQDELTPPYFAVLAPAPASDVWNKKAFLPLSR